MNDKNLPSGNNNDQPKMPKFNMNWIYGLIIIGLAILFFSGGGNALGGDGASKDISYTNFKQYINKGYAKNVVINKQESTLKMYVKPEHIRDVFSMDAKQVGKDPYLTVDFGSVDELDKYLSTAVAKHKITDYSYENTSSNMFLNLLLQLSPLLLFFVLIYFLMRRIGGGGNSGGGVFSVGKIGRAHV